MTKKISLNVNGSPITLDYFVEAFIDHTVKGIIEALENTAPIQELSLSINEDNVNVQLNGKTVPTNRFASKIIKNTIFGMISPLKGVNGTPKELKIEISR